MKKRLITGLLTLMTLPEIYAQQNPNWGVPISPELMHEAGKLYVDINDTEFNTEGQWEQTWRIWLPGRGKPNKSSGYLKVSKSIGPDDSLNFRIMQVISEDNSWIHSTLATVRAEKNAYSTPLKWEKSTRFHTNPASGSRHLDELDSYTSGTVGELDLDDQEHVASSFTLFDVVQRMHTSGLKELEFTLLDELDKIKKKHKIHYAGESSVYFAGKPRKVKVYMETGNGSLPFTYYVDQHGRLLLAISGMRTYILDPGGGKEYRNKFAHPVSALNDDDDISPKKMEQQEISRQPNILFISTDQQVWSSLFRFGNRYVHTPNLDRLAERGYSFYESYSPNPVCSPARATWLTGLTPAENGVVSNGLPIIENIETVADKLTEKGYETVFAGKLHVGIPASYEQQIPGFSKVLCQGIGGKGTLGDQVVSSVVSGYLQNRSKDKPFFLSVNFLQPHDICNWISRFSKENDNPFREFIEKAELPPLPENHRISLNEPDKMIVPRKEWNDKDWQYYLWSYYRMLEEVDAEIGRILTTLDNSGDTENTVIIFNVDHGEGAGRHQSVLKNFLYDEACRVPFIISYPKELKQGIVDSTHLVSGLDVVPTICDYAAADKPVNSKGLSVRGIASGQKETWRKYVVSEVTHNQGRMLRSERFKLITFRNDPNLLFFDMKKDPGETKNLANDPAYREELIKHIRWLEEWESNLVLAPNADPFRVVY